MSTHASVVAGVFVALRSVVAPSQTVNVPEIIGSGFTVIVKLIGEPTHPAKDGVTVIVVVPAADGVNEAMLPEPLAAKPILSPDVVQEYVAEPPALPVKLTVVVVAPKQIT